VILSQRKSLLILQLAILFLLSIGFISPVYAHANLVKSDPPPNSVLQTSPRQITLVFSEQVEPKFTEGLVYDSNGKRVDNGYSIDTKDPTIMAISLPDLPSGVYTVVWKAVSATDGHFTSGSFPFGVGNVTLNIEPNQRNNLWFVFPSPVEVLDRWLNLLSEVSYFGGVVYVLAVWMPAKSNESLKDETRRKIIFRVTSFLEASAYVALLATVVSLMIQSVTAAGLTSMNEFLVSAGTILLSTRFGTVWALRVTAICAAIIISRSLVTRPSKDSWVVALAIGSLLLLTTSLTSHNAASTAYVPVINLVFDWLHLTAVAVWVGGLLHFALALTCKNELNQERRLLLELIRRFSSLAVLSVGVIGLTGLYSLLLEVGTISALFSTSYGILVLAKILLFAPMIVLGAIIQFRVFNGLTQGNKSPLQDSERWPRRFSLSMRSEIAIGMIILMIVGVLTSIAPVAQTSTATSNYSQQSTVLKGSSEEGVDVTMRIFPLQVGSNQFQMAFSDSRGNPITDITAVSVKFRYLDRNVGQASAAATKVGPSQYSFDGTYLSSPGNLELQVSAQRSRGYDIITTFKLEVPPLSTRSSELRSTSASEALTQIALITAGIVLAIVPIALVLGQKRMKKRLRIS